MGTWRIDQSKGTRRYIWGQTRGQYDETWQDFIRRAKTFPSLVSLRVEKIGSEIHCWREAQEEDSGKRYWISCLRFVDEGYGYWTVFYRTDERRWRTTPYKHLPLGQAVEGAAQTHFIDTRRND